MLTEHSIEKSEENNPMSEVYPFLSLRLYTYPDYTSTMATKYSIFMHLYCIFGIAMDRYVPATIQCQVQKIDG